MKINERSVKEPPRIAVKFANMVFVLGFLFCALTSVFSLYRIFNPLYANYLGYKGTETFYIFSILSFGLLAALFALGLKKLSNNLKLFLSVLFFVTGIATYGFEIYLEFFKKNPYNTYFGEDRFINRSYYGGTYAKNNNENNYTKFSASGMDFIVINLDWESDVNELKWAENLLQTYSGHRAIVVSHYILGGAFLNQEDNDDHSDQGRNIYNALKDNPNLFLMLSAHITPNGESLRTDIYNKSSDTDNDDYLIHSLLANYQDRFKGGNGWLRILQFSPVNNEIRVKTYSPFLDIWEEDRDSKFSLFYNMSDPVLSSIEDQTTNSSVAKENFSIIVIPDTQFYSQTFPFIFNVQTQWIVDNRDTWNIVYVAHTGDIVNNYFSNVEWQNASRAMSILEEAISEQFPNGIPYGVVPGNQDLSTKDKIKIDKTTKKKKIINILKLYNLRIMINLFPTP